MEKVVVNKCTSHQAPKSAAEEGMGQEDEMNGPKGGREGRGKRMRRKEMQIIGWLQKVVRALH